MYEEDSSTLLNLFPEEVWVPILKTLQTAQDYQKLCGASPFFQEFLQPRAVEMLFLEVSKLLVDEYLGSKNGVFTAEVQHCREVCRSWKMAVDHVQQNPGWYVYFPMGWTYMPKRDCGLNKKYFDKFLKPLDYEKFQQHFSKTHAASQTNPFVCKGVVFEVTCNIWWESLYEASLIQLLEKYGQHIWYCEVNLSFGKWPKHDNRKLLEAYTKLVQMLELMPNLRAFEFFFRHDPTQQTLMWNEVSDAANLLQFPKFPRLRHIKLINMPIPFLKKLIKSNPQIDCVDARLATPDELQICLEHMPNLTRLSVQITAENLLGVIRSATLNSKIGTMRMHAGSIFHAWHEIFHVLETQFSDNLTELTLSLPRHFPNIARPTSLTLPNLTLLDLSLVNPVPLDFLLPLSTSLKKLFLSAESENDFRAVRKKESVIKLYQVWKSPQKSNVWAIFSKLRFLKTRNGSLSYSCTRADYDWCWN